ncbi:MAG: protein kinase [Ktedonobacterales bacterium]
MTQRVPQRLGKYDLQEPLGRGGMAEVWKAFDTQLRRTVAIKFMHANLAADPDFIARFTREAQVIAALRHSNIVQIYDFYTAEGSAARDHVGSVEGASSPTPTDTITAYMVMEYVQGQTLAQYIATTSRKREFPSPAAVLHLLTPMSLALDYAHRQGAIHRDIKPANILLDHLRHLLVSDPTLEAHGLHGGLNIWTLRVTKEVRQLALNAKSNWSSQRFSPLYRDIVSLLDHLDGIDEVGQDVPAGTPVYASPQIAQIGLLEFDPLHQALPGYLYHISLHLNGVLNAPGSTSYQRSQATKISTALDVVKRDLDQARNDAVQLVKMNATQLAQPSTLTLINDLISVTTNAYQGGTGANSSQEGILQLYPDLQRLATFSVMPYKS